MLAVASWGDIVLWDVAGRQFAGRLRGHVSDVLALAFSADGRWLASGGTEGDVSIWDVAERREAHTLIGGSSERISALVFSPDGARLVAGGEAGSVESGIWRAPPPSSWASGARPIRRSARWR